MKVIQLVQRILALIGALPSMAHIWSYRLWGFIILVTMTANIYAYVLALVVNSGKVSLFLQTLAMSMGAFAAIAKSMTLFISQDTFKTILDTLKDILDKRQEDRRMTQYIKYNEIGRTYSRLYGVFMFFSSQTIAMGPFIATMYGIYHGVYNYRYPCEVVYLVRDETLSEYIAFSLFSAFNIQLNGAFLFAGFFGINLYLVAALEDLCDNFQEIEKIKKPNQLSKLKSQKEKFIYCVYFHRKILGLAKIVQDLFSPIIFFQFLFSCLQICAITLELLLREHITMDRFVQVLPVYPTIWAMLFIYCKFGNDLSIKASEVSTAVYNSEWYSYPMEIQKLIPTLIQQAHNPVAISGFKILPCTLQSYTKALNKVGSLLTIMRQLLNK